jgi:hypothetical protein
MLPPNRRLEQNGMRATGGSDAPTMKHPSDNQSQEVLAGLVERVTYHNVENGFCVLRAKARGHRDVVTVVGHAATIAAGEWITVSGEWVNDRTHGQQFKARFLRTSPVPTQNSESQRNPGVSPAFRVLSRDTANISRMSSASIEGRLVEINAFRAPE